MRGKQGHTIHFSGGKSFSVDELYDRFYNELVLWADTILKDMGEAEDLGQDFFVRLWEKKLNENLVGERVRSYLYVSVRNMAIRKVKDQGRIRRLPVTTAAAASNTAAVMIIPFCVFTSFSLLTRFPFLYIKIHPLQHDNTAKPTLSKKVSCESPKAAFLHG